MFVFFFFFFGSDVVLLVFLEKLGEKGFVFMVSNCFFSLFLSFIVKRSELVERFSGFYWF